MFSYVHKREVVLLLTSHPNIYVLIRVLRFIFSFLIRVFLFKSISFLEICNYRLQLYTDFIKIDSVVGLSRLLSSSSCSVVYRYNMSIVAGSRYSSLKETARRAGRGVSWWTPDRINALYTLVYASPLGPREKKNTDLEPVQTKWIGSLRTHTYRATTT